MKHSLKTTSILVLLFLLSQIVGLIIVQQYQLPAGLAGSTGEFKELPPLFGYQSERPEGTGTSAVVTIVLSILVGTVLILLLVKYNKIGIWKVWYFFAVMFLLNIALGAFLSPLIANALAAILALLKVRKPSTIVHNVTELLVYSGVVVILITMLDIGAAAVLLIVISIYDAYAVWQSRHMVSMAKFQTQSGVFAGLAIPTKHQKDAAPLHVQHHHPAKMSGASDVAILGGGDIGFPLLFEGAVLKSYGMGPALVVACMATVALALLLTYAQPKKFYPAMPFLSAGVFVEFGLVLLAMVVF